VKIIGATAHVVTDDLDTGPIIAQGVLPVDHSYTAADMAQAGRDVEKTVLAKGLNLSDVTYCVLRSVRLCRRNTQYAIDCMAERDLVSRITYHVSRNPLKRDRVVLELCAGPEPDAVLKPVFGADLA
jgi:hypothetical protein